MSKAIFLSGDLRSHLLRLSIPAIISLMVNFSFGIVDILFISQLGHNDLTAISYTFPVFELVVGLGIGLGVAIATCVGQSLGRKRNLRARKTASAGLMLFVTIGGAATVLGLFTIHPLFVILGASENIISYINSFMKIWYFGLIPMLVYFSFAFTSRAYGFAKIVMIVGISSALINLAFDPLLIFGMYGFPKMGIAGAAWAGIIARYSALIICLCVMYKKDMIHKKYSPFTYFKYIPGLFRIAVPAVFTNMIPPLSVIATTIILSRISQEAVAAYGVSNRIQSIIVIPLLALSGSIGAVAAQNYGARNIERMAKALNISLVFSLMWGIFVSVIFLFFSHEIIAPFHQSNFTNEIIYSFLTIIPISYMGWGAIMMITATYNSISKPLMSTLINIFRLLIVYIPCAFIGMHFFGYKGVFFALSFSNVLTAVLAYILFRKHLKTLLDRQKLK